MPRYIDADMLYQKTAEWEKQALDNTKNSEEWLKWSIILAERSAFKFDVADAPTANVVEVVRCKDCKHRPYEDEEGDVWPPSWGDYTCPCLCEDPYYSGMPEDNFFCKSGERKEDAEVQ